MEPEFLDHLVESIKSRSNLIPRAGRTKTGISFPENSQILDISPATGVLEYHPSEYTFTAYAGTPLKKIVPMLAENGQFLPFNPPMVNRGATLGGSVAANMNGPARYYYGGARDFILQVKFFDSQGKMIRSGGKVVKNAAGFDIPKLMVGSLGSLGTMIEISIKVFPKPKSFITAVKTYKVFTNALNSLIQISALPLEILCLEIEPKGGSYELQIRLGGEAKLFSKRTSMLGEHIGEFDIFDGQAENVFWDDLDEFTWVPEGSVLVKIPTTPGTIPELEEFLQESNPARRYSCGANVAWVALPEPLDTLDRKLAELRLSGLTILHSAGKVRLGINNHGEFYRRIKNALDPGGLWVEV
jgi:glycolate oxidase FAD binding subunit